MAIGFHFDDIEEVYFGCKKSELPPISAPIHDNTEDKEQKDLPPIGGIHD